MGYQKYCLRTYCFILSLLNSIFFSRQMHVLHQWIKGQLSEHAWQYLNILPHKMFCIINRSRLIAAIWCYVHHMLPCSHQCYRQGTKSSVVVQAAAGHPRLFSLHHIASVSCHMASLGSKARMETSDSSRILFDQIGVQMNLSCSPPEIELPAVPAAQFRILSNILGEGYLTCTQISSRLRPHEH